MIGHIAIYNCTKDLRIERLCCERLAVMRASYRDLSKNYPRGLQIPQYTPYIVVILIWRHFGNSPKLVVSQIKLLYGTSLEKLNRFVHTFCVC